VNDLIQRRTARGTVAFNPQHVTSDVGTFARLTSTADAQARPSALAEALHVYRGPFLDSFALPDCLKRPN